MATPDRILDANPLTSTSSSPTGTRRRHVQSKPKEVASGTSSNYFSTSDRKSAAEMSKLRNSIEESNKRDELEHRKIAHLAHASQSNIQKLYLVLVLIIIFVFLGGMAYWKPQAFVHMAHGHGYFLTDPGPDIPQWPPHHLALLYPPQTRLKQDLPQFFQQYAIATPLNLRARQAVRKLLATRNWLKNFQIFISAWEREGIRSDYPLDDYCGSGFAAAYDRATDDSVRNIRLAEDLLHWCLLHTYQNDGFLQWNTTLERAPMSHNQRAPPSTTTTTSVQYTIEDTLKGFVPRYVGQDRIHPSFLWLPKKRETVEREEERSDESSSRSLRAKTKTVFDMDSLVPTKMLSWLIHTGPTIDPKEYPTASEEYLFQLIQPEQEHWMLLDAVCNTTANKNLDVTAFEKRRVMGRDCVEMFDADSNVCCTVYMPEGDLITVRRNRLDDLKEQSNSM